MPYFRGSRKVLRRPATTSLVTSGWYGQRITNGTLANTVVGGPNYPRVTDRFVCPRAGQLTSMKFYALWGPGYGGGVNHAGTYQFDIYRDDGTASHFPTGSSLANTGSLNIQTLGGGGNEQKVDMAATLSTPVSVSAGEVIHRVFKQLTGGGTDYCSLDYGYDAFDYLGAFGPESQHAALFPHLAHSLDTTGSGGWSLTQDGRDHFWAIGEFTYTDGTSFGNNNIDSPSNATANGENVNGAWHEITATKAVRQTFTPVVSMRATACNIRLYKVSGTGAVTATLRAGGTTVWAKSVTAATFTTGGRGTGYVVVDADWQDFSIPTTVLTAGTTYTLTLTSTGTGVYRMHTVRDGNAAGYAYSTQSSGFQNGYAEFTDDGSTWHTWDTWGTLYPNPGDMDLQIYFTLG